MLRALIKDCLTFSRAWKTEMPMEIGFMKFCMCLSDLNNTESVNPLVWAKFRTVGLADSLERQNGGPSANVS